LKYRPFCHLIEVTHALSVPHDDDALRLDESAAYMITAVDA
jgi:hypothetical protein